MNTAEYEIMASAECEHWWYWGLRDLIARTLRSYVLPQSGQLSVLDAGCGTGENLRLLRDVLAPHYLGGFDISPHALEHAARKIPGADLYQSDICDPQLHVSPLDVILSCDVLDVPGAPAALPGLKRLGASLRPGGLMILNVPAFAWLRSRHDLAVGSRQRFTARRIRQLLHEAALRVELVTYRVWTLFPLIVLARLPSILRPPADPAAARSDLASPRKTSNAVLRGLMAFENQAIAAGLRLPWGSSVFAVGRKT